MPQVRSETIKARAAALRRTADRMLGAHLDARVGRPVTVLSEGRGLARAPDFSTVRVSPETPKGVFVEVTPESHDGRALIAA